MCSWVLPAILLTAVLACAPEGTGSVGPEVASFSSRDAGSSDELLSLDEELLQIGESVEGFGGLKVASGRVLLILQDTTTERVQAALGRITWALSRSRGELRHALGLPIEVHRAPFTFATLHAWRRLVDESDLGPGLVFTDTDEEGNTVTVGVADEPAKTRFVAALERLGIPPQAVRVIVTAHPRPSVSLTDVVSPTAGGVQVPVSWSEAGVGRTKGSSLTGNVVWLAGNSSDAHFVTCAHCTAKAFRSDPPSTWYQATVLHPQMSGAGEVADPAFFAGGSCPQGKVCRWSEAAIVKYGASASNWFPQVAWAPNSFTLEILSYYLIDQSPASIGNSWYVKTGRTTGSSSGYVTQSCVTFTPNYAGYMALGDTLPSNAIFLCQHWASYSSSGGDSGAPVYQIPNSPPSPTAVVMRGVHHAGASGTLSVFSPISGVNKDFGIVRWDLY